MDQNYNEAVDIWSLGCILFELIYSSNPYHDCKEYDVKNRVLFKGDSCYPMSPCRSTNS